MQENIQKPEPLGNDQWAVHALNIHGTFFERRCQVAVQSVKGWNIVDTNYPVEYRDQASNLDIWAVREVQKSFGDDRRLTLPIECKKNNPDFVDWIFFPQPSHRIGDLSSQILRVYYGSGRLTCRRELWDLTHDLVVADDARETKGDYLKIQKQQDKTKTSNDAITKAATQITLATQALVAHESALLQAMSNDTTTSYGPPYNYQFFLPTIVTTANLFSCQFEDTDIDLSKGEIALDKVQLVPHPYLLFNYAVPLVLQSSPKDVRLSPAQRETFTKLARLPIFIVNSTAFPTFLQRLGGLLIGERGLEMTLQPAKQP